MIKIKIFENWKVLVVTFDADLDDFSGIFYQNAIKSSFESDKALGSKILW